MTAPKQQRSPPNTTDALFEVNDGVATLIFNRDDVRNVLTGTHLIDDINRVCHWINHNPEIACLVISANGKAFSAGGNIKDMQSKQGMFGGDGFSVQDAYRHGIQTMTMNIYQLEVPVIAAINGAAIGAGMDLCCMCDIRLGCEYTKLGETFVNLGIIPGDGGAWFLPRLVGAQRAAELTFSGRIIKAEQALDYGLLMDIVPADELLQRAQQLARSFADKPRQALRISKRLLQAGHRLPLRDFLDYCASQQSLCHDSDQHQQALAAMLEQL
ncbi:enoyl-CoA hydratase-related protein [Dasania marina]|uniref:enoyl-CoA hydratase-related protein n=1 Tax=Dasania marina TaxID=471499 RepID=UPI00037B3BAB|nr:enoyl-CoA hydratase-related protein [Dasania marina]